jgi:hypothetical protein
VPVGDGADRHPGDIPLNDIIENVIAGVIVTAIAWLSALAWSRWHRSKENTE